MTLRDIARRRTLALLGGTGVAALLPTQRPQAGPDPSTPAPGLTPRAPTGVVAVRDDGTLALADGETLVLTAVRLPHETDLPPAHHTPEESARVQAWRAAALTWLRAACDGRMVRLWVPRLSRDRHGRLLAQARVWPTSPLESDSRSGLWVQAGLIANGLARVDTMAGAANGADRLLTLEAMARRAGRGLWGDRLFRPRPPDRTWPWVGTFQIVRGVVLDVAQVRGRLYLNFGSDWRRDFTVMVDRPRRTDVDPAQMLDLHHHLVQVRGWLFPRNGPMIALDHAAPLETRVWIE